MFAPILNTFIVIHSFIHLFLPSALIRREWKSKYDRVMKTLGSPLLPGARDLPETVVGLVTQDQATTPKRKQGSVRSASCPPDCTHSAPLPSDILIEMKVGVPFLKTFGGAVAPKRAHMTHYFCTTKVQLLL